MPLPLLLVLPFLQVSRSATLLMAFMMKKYDMPLREVFDLVKSRRPKVQPTDLFTDLLMSYESEIFPERESEINFKYITGYTARPSSLHSTMSLKGDAIQEGEEPSDNKDTNDTEEKKESPDTGCCSCCTVS